MNGKIMAFAAVLVVLAGMLFVFPVTTRADMEAVACPGLVCVTSAGGNGQGSGKAAWGVEHTCYVTPPPTLQKCEPCCQECLNYVEDEDHIVGICKTYVLQGCGSSEEYELSCPV